MSSQADRDWAYGIRLAVEEMKTGIKPIPWFERNAAAPVDPLASVGEESQDAGCWEPA
ncbi:hypothetical protein M3A96_02740 [Helcobacillus massiliensis]|uniref:Uncharacterized protein n=1 Tax=Helcobacillus massiliensis TaxID=521392 RepID=A0A839QRW2_9MICO|nr:hypothetical protein [Helcobacillus massiliensis]MBB3022408.1 hypothetical protein [Helcobacillus massiliensis]MCT1557045.1 hypothetical protein [Helcobacillus massiliensis]MCT2035434.1 hypothetical protein [Helcobacillus massiliensis]MCT2331351.1 hypothetical protein [Helcobacillus massiliensis]